MSVWTHVSGCLRIDGLVIPGFPTPKLEPVLGTPSTNYFLHPDGPYREAKGIPTGSEGSIQYRIIDAGNGMVWKTVAVWGDLRDFDETDCAEIDAWFAGVVASDLMLRAAHLVVETEYGASYLLIADEKNVLRLSLGAGQ